MVLVIATDCDGNISQGLGIMIIEGSHKATGNGIFVSDIQEKSAAFHVSKYTYLSNKMRRYHGFIVCSLG